MHPHERTHTNAPTRIRLVLSQVRGHSWKTASAEQAAAPLVERAPPPTSSPCADPTLLAEAVALPAFWEALVKGLISDPEFVLHKLWGAVFERDATGKLTGMRRDASVVRGYYLRVHPLFTKCAASRLPPPHSRPPLPRTRPLQPHSWLPIAPPRKAGTL